MPRRVVNEDTQALFRQIAAELLARLAAVTCPPHDYRAGVRYITIQLQQAWKASNDQAPPDERE